MTRKDPHLHVFDFDDTLFTTDNIVTINIPGSPPIDLNSREFALLEKNKKLPTRSITEGMMDNAEINFDNFDSVLNPEPIKKNLYIFRNILKYSDSNNLEDSNLYIVTARGGEKNRIDIKKTIDSSCKDLLPNTGFPLSHIITKDLQKGIGSTAEKKKNTVEELMNQKNIKKVHFLDDAPKNVELMKELPGRSRLVQMPEENTQQNSKNILGAKMPRKNVPHRVDEIADSILKSMKKGKKKMSEEKMYDIAYGTAWKTYYEENPGAEEKRKKKSDDQSLDNLKIAQMLDDINLFSLADKFEKIAIK